MKQWTILICLTILVAAALYIGHCHVQQNAAIVTNTVTNVKQMQQQQQEIDDRLQRMERMLGSDEPSRGVRSLTMIATAYTPAADEGGHLDALGSDLVPYRTIAVDPTVIPLGSRLLVRCQGKIIAVGIARDTGSAIHGNKIDLCMLTKTEAYRWGRRQVEVTIIN